MDLNQLEYFQALAINGNLTQTSKDLFITAPALSTSISRLEKELGVKLFDRKNNRLYLNANGAIFLKRVDQIINELSYAVDELQHSASNNNKLITVASTSPNVFQVCFGEFLKLFPQYKLSYTWLGLTPDVTQDVLKKDDFLIANPSDFAFLDKCESRLLYDNDYAVLLVPPESELAGLHEIALSDVKDYPFIALSSEYSSRRFFDKVCERAGFIPNIVVECNYTIRPYMIQQNLGLSIATAYSKLLNHCGLCAAIKINPPFMPRSQSIYWDSSHFLSPAATEFLNFICDYYKDASFELE